MEDSLKTPRRRLAPTIVVTCLAATLAGSAIGREPDETNRATPSIWSSDLLRDAANWPHSERDARIVGSPTGLRVEVAAERQFAIAAMSGLGLRKALGQIRVRRSVDSGWQPDARRWRRDRLATLKYFGNHCLSGADNYGRDPGLPIRQLIQVRGYREVDVSDVTKD